MTNCARCEEGLYNIDVKAGKCLSCGRSLTLTIKQEMKQKVSMKAKHKFSLTDKLKVIFGGAVHINYTIIIDVPKGYSIEAGSPTAAEMTVEPVIGDEPMPEKITDQPDVNVATSGEEPSVLKSESESPVEVEEPNLDPPAMDKIISGFPGIGKTYYYNNSNGNALDSDSSAFSWLPHKEGEEKVRNPEFPANYMKHIAENIGKVDIILVSSHKEVRDALYEAGIPFTLVYPDKDSKVELLARYKERGSDEKFLEMLDVNWDKFMAEMEAQQGCDHVVLPSGMYLSEHIENADKTEA